MTAMAWLGEPAIQHLCRSDDDWRPVIRLAGPRPPPSAPQRSPYEALARAVIYQQLHGRAAAAITARLLALYPRQRFPQPAALLATPTEMLRSCGLSARKIETLRGIAEGRLAGIITTRAKALRCDDEALIAQWTQLRGVGRWTAEMVLMDTLARPDIMPVGDFGVREGWRLLKRLPTQPTPAALLESARPWQPYRSTAAWYLWRVVDLSRAGALPG